MQDLLLWGKPKSAKITAGHITYSYFFVSIMMGLMFIHNVFLIMRNKHGQKYAEN